MERILIEVKGGNIQNIITTKPLEIFIVDFDNINQGGDLVSYQKPNHIFKRATFYKFYVITDEQNKEIRSELKRLYI